MARITYIKHHAIICAIVARQNDAIIYIITSAKSHAVICAIVTRKSASPKSIMREMREIRRIFGESELCVYR